MWKKPKQLVGTNDLTNRKPGPLAREDITQCADANDSAHTMRKRPHESRSYIANVGRVPSGK
jgi:hypothetical protein